MPLLQDTEYNDLVLLSFVSLVSEIIDNEPNMIRILLKEDETSVIKSILKNLEFRTISKTCSCLIKQIDSFKVVSKFFGRLALTEQGCAVVSQQGAIIIQKIIDNVRSIRVDQSDNEFFEIDSARERLFQIKNI